MTQTPTDSEYEAVIMYDLFSKECKRKAAPVIDDENSIKNTSNDKAKNPVKQQQSDKE